MNIKYIGMDVHKEAISIAVMTGEGRLVMESIIETKASTILQFIQGLRGDLHVTFEEGTWAAWLYDLLKPHVTKLIVCDPRKNALLKEVIKQLFEHFIRFAQFGAIMLSTPSYYMSEVSMRHGTKELLPWRTPQVVLVYRTRNQQPPLRTSLH